MIRRDGQHDYLVISDLKVLELLSNLTAITGGTTWRRHDGREVSVFSASGFSDFNRLRIFGY